MTITYVGSKRRIIKDLLPIIMNHAQYAQTVYIEPFVGGCNSIAQVPLKNRIAYDVNPFLISFWQLVVRDGPEVLNDQITEGDYQAVRDLYESFKYNPEGLYLEERAFIGWVGFAASFGGKFWGGYARGKSAKGEPRNYPAEIKRAVIKNYDKIKDVEFHCSSFYDIEIPKDKDVIIYCDPPYEGTTSYRTDDFPHNAFWQWVKDNASDRVRIYVSEYGAPMDFECLWQQDIKSSLAKDLQVPTTEKLFVYKGE